MKIRFDATLWDKKGNSATIDVTSPFAPVNKILLFRREGDGKTVSSDRPPVLAAHEFYCIYLCLKGSGYIETDGIQYFVEEGEAIGVLPYHPHRRVNSGYVQYLLIRFLSADPEFVSSLFGGTVKLESGTGPYIQDLVTSYENVLRNAGGQSCNEVGLRLALLLNKMKDCERNALSEKKFSNQRVHDALQMIIAPENLNLSMREIAGKLGVTPGHLSDLVHDKLGYAPRGLRQMTRHRTAVNNLLHSTLSISQIAELSGFRSIYAFSRFFRNITGMSPTAFRRKYGKAPAD
ncbi:MAG: helix-turn-helix transcriptional regulator [Lentisphaeria bacterium]|nr:helix-turn-helix transcriptional regulator [Lentisphaeria bacterium]